ncbi:MAG TPA: 2,3-bisphosphoglycerate-independent phosphoglycerate mutase, partial [Flavobacteriales bacterium]|nr:2,3-bisphosphoglycerate-independent phosphoglycerate mutase [Flavobacteriales bacterium]
MSKKVILMILDGWGITQDPKVSAIAQADTPFIDDLLKKYPHAKLYTSGENVGLPEGQMGNSEVGHMNLGAGRIVYQDLVKINKAIKDGSFFENQALKEAFEYAKENHKAVHLLGLLSNGGVHSHIDHLKALIDMAKKYNVPTYIHTFMDGRDVDPHSGVQFLKEIQEYIKDTPVKIASVIGRYYAMD